MLWAAIAISAILGYALGSIQWGIIVSRITRGVDVRDYGSGATGATNVIRTSGAKAGVAVMLLDIAKGILPVYIGIGLGHLFGIDAKDDRAWAAAAGAFAAVVGHCWPVFYGFRGGKAVATASGAALAMNPLAVVVMIPVAVVIVGATRIMSVMSILMPPLVAVLFVVLAALDISPWAWAAYGIPTAIVIVYRHRANIERLMAGTEPRIGKGGDKRPDSSVEATAKRASA
jgi:glycerol-3-phosphate acyltransferase PlsY